ncbi:DUF4172 domain-containing protein [Xylanibacter oryzae]|uniref:DUF4172 domain-containing protein n=1 Tax=Xylanibacter oryzae TaxID=185293 RepID=UPI001FE048C6|nr:DUF4172 domain-containing protein [Xylanibacter oryzae]
MKVFNSTSNSGVKVSNLFVDKEFNTKNGIANDILASSAIEGIILDLSEVRSSIARKLGIKVADEKAPTHYIGGIVEMMLDATVNYLDPLSEKRLFS